MTVVYVLLGFNIFLSIIILMTINKGLGFLAQKIDSVMEKYQTLLNIGDKILNKYKNLTNNID